MVRQLGQRLTRKGDSEYTMARKSMFISSGLLLLVSACSPAPPGDPGKAVASPAGEKPSAAVAHGVLPPANAGKMTGASEPDRELAQATGQVMPYISIAGREAVPISTPKAREQLLQGAERLEAYHRGHPDEWRALWLAGKAFQAAEDGTRALAAFREVFELQKSRLDIAKDNPDLAREYMIECVKAGKGGEAVEAAQYALGMAPRNPGLIANLGLALLIAGRTGEAVSTIERAVTLAPRDPISRGLLQIARQVETGQRPPPACYADLTAPCPSSASGLPANQAENRSPAAGAGAVTAGKASP
jgi:tetratricopeptide (TPR) repeat protein